ncbi:PREDICTED: conserved oligomeric Golgi complex subunit 2 [Ceratosolen solmsi marchali]|uniref:Conserved oligomeric Golgi complex subunit 2 n=1 Tax=Ceratosolen solmsi marchali TaxID=326594 RepID=A0AAJ6YV78_9HYME|nr:PREDICTED: conserved oligomeric Golgi complex subunit 2 [Ceratosolen solmsi marchali]
MTENNFIPPKSPKDLCFNELDFTQKLFDADKFLQEHRKNVSLEKMRDDLGIYLKILRSAMIELINKDYADFVTLSSNLIGLDKAINNLETPLGQLKEEIMQIRQCLDDTILEMTNNLDKHKEIRERKQCVNSLIKYHKSISKLSNILTLCDTPENVIKPDVLERAATEFNQLKFHTNRCQSELTTEQINEINGLDKRLKTHLDTLLVTYVTQKQSASLIRCLRIYVSLDKITDAEEIIRKKIIVPAVENIISEYSFQNDPLGLNGTYKKLEQILDSTLSELLEITQKTNRISVNGFNFLVNSYWPEVEQRIEDYLPIIFAPGNPELFHKQYMESLHFLLTLEKKCDTIESINQLKNHPQYERFLKKWNLPVYFQIRFQEIAGTVESILSANITSASIRNNTNSISADSFTLHGTCILWDCIQRIWAKEVYLPQLLHRFWKLCLQLCSRYQKWCRSSLKQAWPVVKVNETSHNSGPENSERLEFLVGLYTDTEKISAKISHYTEFVDKVENLSPSIINLLHDCMKETIKDFEDCLPLITQEIVNELLRYSMTHLRQISDIPRLFRRTNREVPTKPCAYVKRALDFLITFRENYKNIIKQTIHHWLVLTLTTLTQQYMSLVIDVLTSVQKTEESLRRLKKIRDKTAGVLTSENQGISDDEKIHIQLFIDVTSYIQMIKELDVEEDNIENLKKLLEVVESATKNKVDLK